MLTSVLISNVATFTGKAQEFGKLEKVNFVYGANGCGKTTISRVIAHPEQHKACSLEWEGNIPLQTLVYNRDFIEDNFKTLDSIKGIFTLGTEDDDIRASIDERRRQMNECDDDIKRAANNLEGEDGLGGKKHDLEKQNEKIEEYCWEQIKKPYDADFQKAFEGLRNNKKRFADEFVGKSSSQASVSRTKDELIDEAQTVFGEQKNALHRYEIPDFESFRSNLRSTIYTKTIVGGKDVDIAEMISRLGNSDWVRHGQHQLRHTSGKCPFCQQDLPSGFAEKLEQYFDETFMADVAELKEQNGLCVRLWNDINSAVQRILTSDEESFVDKEQLNGAMQRADARFSLIKKCLDEKEKEPGRSLEMPSLDDEAEAVCSIIREANKKIDAHNRLVENIAESQKKLKEDIWCFLVEEHRTELKKMIEERDTINKTIAGLRKTIEVKSREKERLRNEISELQKQLTSIEPTIKEINDILDSFGFMSFRLVAQDRTSYKLIRLDESEVGDTLSEGEKSFVTFLYFYHLLNGGMEPETLSENRIAVIDDPVSSLDSNILFVVSALIRKCIVDICNDKSRLKQLIVLTHNVYFHKEVTYKFHDRQTQCAKKTYWTVRKDAGVSCVRKEAGNPIKTSYELLWKEIQEPNVSKVGIRNAMRRIIEYYFQLLGGIDLKKEGMEFKGDDFIVYRSLFSWMNDGSHFVDDDLQYQVDDIEIETYKNVFKNIFEITGQKAHYEMMMRNVGGK